MSAPLPLLLIRLLRFVYFYLCDLAHLHEKRRYVVFHVITSADSR